MNLDELISKYIDAELAPEEDSNLREFISESEKARDIFDRSVGIHIAIREDAQTIMPPKDLVRETESKVMMQIMALQAEPAPVVHKINSGRVRFYQMAAAAAVMFLVGVITISDLNIINRFGFNELARLNREDGLSRNFYIDEAGTMTPLGDGIQTIEMPREKFVPSVNSAEFVPLESSILAYSQSSEIAARNSNSLPNMPALPPVLFETSAIAMGNDARNAMFASSSENVTSAAAPSLGLHQAFLSQLGSKSLDLAGKDSKVSGRTSRQIRISGDLGFDIGMIHSIVNVTSHFGTDIARFGFDNAENSSVSHFSQAISFSLDESNFLGVEMGYTQYTCKDQILVKISSGGGGHQTEGKEPSSGEIPPQYQVTPKSVSNNKQLLWCVGFWEWNFLSSGDFSLDTRLGLGASAEGPLGLSRLMTRYELIKGLYLSVGLEGRLFKANMEELSNSKSTFKSSTSVVYGLQLKF